MHQNLASSTAETESVIGRLHSQHKPAPLPQKGILLFSQPDKYKELDLWCKFPQYTWELTVRIAQMWRLSLKAEAVVWYSGSKQLGTRSPSLAEVLHTTIIEHVIPVFYFFFPPPLARGQVYSREVKNQIYS